MRSILTRRDGATFATSGAASRDDALGHLRILLAPICFHRVHLIPTPANNEGTKPTKIHEENQAYLRGHVAVESGLPVDSVCDVLDTPIRSTGSR